ncbi:MAG: cyclic nucleotide-binding domain-containing protein, partial [Chitinivibrionales bacterium]|nr:cyclic nucleotide-binding domain-containing protein [Chitinivibrionales bacterium]
EEYAASDDSDLRCLAVRIFARQGTRQSLDRLREMYERDGSRAVREVIARSLGDCYWYETKGFVEQLLGQESPRIRANALFSLSEMNARWKWEFRDAARAMLFDSSLRVQIEAARFLWLSGDDAERQSIRALMANLLGSRNPNKRSAGIYLVGELQPPDWELILTRNLTADAPSQVFGKSIETILRYASEATRLAALETVEQLPRERIAQAGRAAQQAGVAVVPVLVAFLGKPRNQRMSFEVVHALRVIKHGPGNEAIRFDIDHRTERNVLRWVVRELRSVYLDAYMWYSYCRERGDTMRLSAVQLLDSALRERVFRVAEWALDAMVLLDREGLITWGRRDLDMREYANRLDMIEILESLGSHRVGALTVPLLKFESWESLGKRGRFLLKGRRLERSGGLVHFLHADNRWVCLCALYALRQTQYVGEQLPGEAIEALKRLSVDNNQHLAGAAKSMLAFDRGEAGFSVESFQLLETVLFLKQTPLFRDVPGEKLMPVAEICEQKEYARKTVISREGDVSDHLYVVKSGAVRIVKNFDGSRERTLATIEPGETYGEVGLFGQAQRSATAVAHTDCRLYEVQRSALKRLLLTVPEIAYNFLEIFSEKLRRSAAPAVRADVDSIGKKAIAS